MSNRGVTLSGLLTAAGVLACIATLAGFLGEFWWGFELASHFRVQYLFVLSLGAALLLVWRSWQPASGFALFALLNLAILAPRLLSPLDSISPAADTRPIRRAVLANINAANQDHQRIQATLLAQQADFVLLLEVTPWLLDRLTELKARYPYHVAEPREDNFGIALLSRWPVQRAEMVRFGTADLPSIVAEIADGPQRFTLVGTHPLPPMNAAMAQARNGQLAEIANFVRHHRQPVLLLGDLNVSPWSPYFARLLRDSGLRDSGHGRGILPSWPVGWPPLWIPIDHALISPQIRLQARQTGPALGSDHYPIMVDFQLIGP